MCWPVSLRALLLALPEVMLASHLIGLPQPARQLFVDVGRSGEADGVDVRVGR